MNDYENALQGWFPRQPDAGADTEMLGSAKKSPEHAAALDRVREWTRERFKLPGDAGILVSEVACTLPGCPPLETVVAFWSDEPDGTPGKRHHFKLFKAVANVTADDLPFAWLKDTLVVPEGFECECC